MLRRLHVSSPLDSTGPVALDSHESHHARDVLRLGVGDDVELFDDAGAVAMGPIIRSDPAQLVVEIRSIVAGKTLTPAISIATAVPKGDRADWMIEKLSELGVERFVPLRADRSVVLPAGKSKRERWNRIAIESAKQSRRRGVMLIDELMALRDAIDPQRVPGAIIVLSTNASAMSAIDVCTDRIRDGAAHLVLLVGPEGGWSDEELMLFQERGLTRARLTETILRVETAAVAAATVACVCRAATFQSQGS